MNPTWPTKKLGLNSQYYTIRRWIKEPFTKKEENVSFSSEPFDLLNNPSSSVGFDCCFVNNVHTTYLGTAFQVEEGSLDQR